MYVYVYIYIYTYMYIHTITCVCVYTYITIYTYHAGNESEIADWDSMIVSIHVPCRWAFAQYIHWAQVVHIMLGLMAMALDLLDRTL